MAATVLRAGEMQLMDFDWGHLEWYCSGEQGNSVGLTFGKCVLKPGGANPQHFHPNCEEVLHVISGRIVHHLDGEPPVEMGPGDTITLPQGSSHHAENCGDVDAELMIAFSSAERTMEKV